MSAKPIKLDPEEILGYVIGYIESYINTLDSMDTATQAYVLGKFLESLNNLVVEEKDGES